MTEQEWLERTLSPTERCNPHAIRQQRAIYQGWINHEQASTDPPPADRLAGAACNVIWELGHMSENPVCWLLTWNMKQSGPQASAYLTEDAARGAAKNVEAYAHATEVRVAPAYLAPPADEIEKLRNQLIEQSTAAAARYEEVADDNWKLREQLVSKQRSLQWIVNSPRAPPSNMVAVARHALTDDKGTS